MRQVIAFSLKRKTVNPGRFLSYTLLLRRLLRCSAVASIVGMAALVFFPVYLAHAAPVLYIPNQYANTVSVLDGSNYSAIKTISVSQEPYGVGVSPDGKTVFITNMAADSVSVIDTGTNTVTNTISVGNFPFGVAISPDGRYAFVANAADDNLSVIETSGYTVVANITVGDDPHGVVVHPDGSKLYVTNYFGSTVSVINTSTYSLIKTIAVGTYPHGIAIHPSGSYVYTANVLGDSLSVISTSSNSVIKTLSMGKHPFFPAIDPLGKFLYVSNHGSNSVTVVDASSNTAVGNIPVGSAPHGISLDSTGSRMYVANEGGNSISVIDTSSRTVIATVSVSMTPIAFGNFAAEPMIPSPTGANQFAPYTDAAIPLLDSDPDKARPIGMGTIAGVGAILSLSVGANKFSGPMDVYLGLSMPTIDPVNFYLFTSAGLQPISAGLLPWKSSVTDISGVVLPDLDALILPTGTYTFYLLVVPAGTSVATSLVDYYLWGASLSVVRASDVSDKAIALFGTDLAAAVAILLAYDNGYSLDQVLTAIDAGTLSSLGEIQGALNTASGSKALRGGQILAAECAGLDLEDDYYRMVCENRIEEKMRRIEISEGRRAVDIVVLHDYGYTSEQIFSCFARPRPTTTLTPGDNWCEPTMLWPFMKNCWIEQKGGEFFLDCRTIIHPDKLAANKYTETMAAICPILGGNRDSRIISNNPFMSSQAVSPIPGLKRASFSDSCTPICTDSDGDGYYVQSGCGTGGAVDCNDGNSNINPAMPESCADGVDNNCDGKIDTLDPGCNPPTPCPDPGYPTPCGPECYPAGYVCCDAAGNACEAGAICASNGCCTNGDLPCGAGCMPAGNVCCGEVACPPGSECCGASCMPADAVCCGEVACAAGYECCGAGCMPAGNVCCAPLGHCPPGCTCDYENQGCICP